MDSPDVKEKMKNTPEKEKGVLDNVFPWLKPALGSRRTIKTWIRCCIALAASMMLMVATKPSHTMGQAAFFCVIVAVMLPPTFALSVFLMASTTLLFGMLVGWAWGSAAMASALSVRSASLYAQQTQKLQSLLDPNSIIPIPRQIQIQTFHGIFLDPRSSAVYGAFLFIGSFALGALRAYIPSLTLLSIFGTIVMDVACTTGPLLPRAQYTVPEQLIIPATFYVAVAIGTVIFIFPESLSHVWLTLLLDSYWTKTLDLLRLQSETLELLPSDHEAWAQLNARGTQIRTGLVAATDAVSDQLKLIDLDTSIGRLGPTDLKRINLELKSIMFRASGLHSFQSFVNDSNIALKKEAEASQHLASASEQATRYQALSRRIRNRELKNGHDLDSLVPILASSSLNLRKASESAIICLVDWFQECNSRRFSAFVSRPSHEVIAKRHEKLVKELQDLESALQEFRTIERVKLIKPYERFFDPKTRLLLKDCDMFTSKSLYICFVFIDTIDAFSEAIAKLLKLVVEIDEQRPKSKIWFPGRIAKVRKNITNGDFKSADGPIAMGTSQNPVVFSSNDSSETSLTDSDSDDEDDDEEEKRKLDAEEKICTAEPPKRHDPDAFPPTTALGRMVVSIAPFFRFFKSPEGIFSLRMGIVSIALWMPSIFHSTAWFYYDNKGLWALIMGQIGLAVYAGDQIAGFIVRIIGTLIGLLVGIVVWYIGAGHGHGNPYGLVVATTLIISPFLFARVAATPAQVGIFTMICVTTVFVVGYSWVNANINVISNPGVGVTLGWKRALLVIIGFTAGFIVMLFPNPISSRVLVRKTLAAVISESANIFAGEVEAFLKEEQKGRSGIYEKIELLGRAEPDDKKVSPKERRIRRIARRVIAVSYRLRMIAPSLSTAKFEPQISGRWPHEQYEELHRLQTRILGSLALLTTSFSKLDTKWCSALVHRSPFMNPNFLSDVFSTIAIVSTSLMDGRPLPAFLPKLRDRLIYHEYHTAKTTKPSFAQANFLRQPVGENDDKEKDEQEKEKSLQTDSSSELLAKGEKSGFESEEEIGVVAGPVHVDGSSVGIELDELTLDILLNEQLPAHSTAVVALSSLLSRVDEMIDITRVLCGQATFRGYEGLQQDYLDREERAVGGFRS